MSPYKKVYKADMTIFKKMVLEFLEENNDSVTEKNSVGRKEYHLNTIHGKLTVQHPDFFNEDKDGPHYTIALMCRFHDWNSLPDDERVNKFSGKWNFHICCPKGDGDSLALYMLDEIENILMQKEVQT